MEALLVPKFPVSGAQRHSLQPGEVIKPENGRSGGRGRSDFLRRILVQLIRAEKGRALPSLRLSIIETWLQGQPSTSMLTTKRGVHTGWRNMPVSGSMRQPETEERAQARARLACR